MATEAPLTDQAAGGHVEEKNVTDDIKNITDEKAAQPTETEVKDEEEKLKAEDLASSEAPVTEVEEKLDDKISETVVEEVKKEEEEIKNLDGASEKVEAPKEESEIPPASEPAVEIHEKELKGQVQVSDVSKSPCEAVEEPTKDLETPPVVEKPSMDLETPPVVEEPTKDLETPPVVLLPPFGDTTSGSLVESESTKEPAVPEPVIDETKTDEPPTVTETEVIVTETPEANESVEVPQEEKTLAGEVEASLEPPMEECPSNETPIEIKLEDETDKAQEIAASESLDTAAAESNETTEFGEGVVAPPEGVEKCGADSDANGVVAEPVKDESGTGKEEEVVKEVAPDNELAAGSGVAKSLEARIKEEKPIEAEKPKLGEPAKEDASIGVADVEGEKASECVEVVEEKKDESLEGEKPSLVEISKDVAAATEVAESPSEAEKPSGGVEMVVEKKDESLEGNTPALVETSREFKVEGDERNDEPLAKEPEEALEPIVASSQDKKEETEKAVRSLAETMKNDNESKTGEDVPKQEVPAKPSHRQSNNIISKVKHSMVKLKKAILGKSPSSKTVSTEGKDDIKVK